MKGGWACYSSNSLSTLRFTLVDTLHLLFRGSSFTPFLLYSGLHAQSHCHNQSSNFKQPAVAHKPRLNFLKCQTCFWISKLFLYMLSSGLDAKDRHAREMLKGTANIYLSFFLLLLSPDHIASSFAAPFVS